MRNAFIAIFGTLFMQWPEKIRKATYTPIACCLVLSGCTIGQLFGYDQLVGYDQPLSIEEYQARYSNFSNPWVGHQVEELITELGLPDNVLEAKPKWSSFEHGVHVLSYIYYNETAEGGSCIHRLRSQLKAACYPPGSWEFAANPYQTVRNIN